MSTNCSNIVIFPIYGQFGAIQKLDSRNISANLTFSFTVTFYLARTKNRTKKSLTQLSHSCSE